MIKSIKIPKGSLLADLNVIKDMTFTDGVNIIYAPNGAGKSVLLKSLSHIFPTKYPKPSDYSGSDKSFKDYLNKAISAVDVDYDGGAVYYFDYSTIQNSDQKLSKVLSGAEGSLGEALNEVFSKPSSGQKSFRFIDKLLNLDGEVKMPDDFGVHNDVWEKAKTNFVKYYSKFPKTGKPVLLLDEIETSLDPDKQLLFLDGILATLSEKFQIICVTHNPMILYFHWYNIINFYPDKSARTLQIHKWLFEQVKP